VREPTIVIGGGLVGLATALALVRRGEPVVVCEK
jgi:2-polyprenyl-6-methoxyphenol hydroxylase-like FAD-dependent oxidoreductase